MFAINNAAPWRRPSRGQVPSVERAADAHVEIDDPRALGGGTAGAKELAGRGQCPSGDLTLWISMDTFGYPWICMDNHLDIMDIPLDIMDIHHDGYP